MSDPVTASEKYAASIQVSDSPNGNSNYAFLVHSQKTIPGNLPPDVDNKSLARQKRRRTSPEDHAILEAEYQKNPKPDKAARVDIVNRVALGEKEVQIWFQNRRQNDRRKSRPLEPGEVSFALFRPSVYSIPAPLNAKSGTQHQSGIAGQETVPPTASSSQFHSTSNAQSSPPLKSSFSSSVQSTSESDTPAVHNIDLGSSQPVSDLPINTSLSQTPQIHMKKERPSSMRLSMTLDGNAQVMPNTFEISPPKFRLPAVPLPVPRVGGLKRSQSAMALGEMREGLTPMSTSQTSRRTSMGRSRDARTWEFYCDSDARDALTTQAERENSGSAAGAIGLIRSRSNTALTQNASGRNIQLQKVDATRNKHNPSKSHRKPHLSRATSSLARLQSSHGNVKHHKAHPARESSKRGEEKGEDLGSPTGDSDKENWIPGTQVSNVARQQGSSRQTQRKVLSENRHIPSQSSGLEALLAADKDQDTKHKQPIFREDKENFLDEDDGEVAAFMSGSRRSSGGADLDCVQGLLSLSQGAWR